MCACVFFICLWFTWYDMYFCKGCTVRVLFSVVLLGISQPWRCHEKTFDTEEAASLGEFCWSRSPLPRVFKEWHLWLWPGLHRQCYPVGNDRWSCNAHDMGDTIHTMTMNEYDSHLWHLWHFITRRLFFRHRFLFEELFSPFGCRSPLGTGTVVRRCSAFSPLALGNAAQGAGGWEAYTVIQHVVYTYIYIYIYTPLIGSGHQGPTPLHANLLATWFFDGKVMSKHLRW